MTNVNALLSQRLNKNEKTSKMAEMAKQSASGNLTSFTGLFNPVELQEGEKQLLESILEEYANGESVVSHDLRALIAITTEVKAISNQAALLHGERIKKAQEILKKYKEGAFTAWLIATYGNRQTPYNFLQYYEFYTAMPKGLHPRIEAMPRQAVYTLASRPGPIEKKREVVEGYNGETKTELLARIREYFPIADGDRRKEDVGNHVIRTLSFLLSKLVRRPKGISKNQKTEILALLEEIQTIVS